MRFEPPRDLEHCAKVKATQSLAAPLGATHRPPPHGLKTPPTFSAQMCSMIWRPSAGPERLARPPPVELACFFLKHDGKKLWFTRAPALRAGSARRKRLSRDPDENISQATRRLPAVVKSEDLGALTAPKAGD